MGESVMLRERVRVDQSEGIAEVVLHRPDKLNCLDLPMFEAIVEAGEVVSRTKGVRVVVLRGEGRSFCSGLDFPSFMAEGEAGQERLLVDRTGPANLAQRVAWIWQELKVPVIAVLQGHVLGGGLQIALGADIRLAHPEAQLSVMEIKWGFLPDMGLTRTLLPLVGPDVAKELIWTGRKVTGEEAAALGLVTRVEEDPLEAARQLALGIAGRNPAAIQRAKRLVNEAVDLDTAGAFALETELQREILGTPNMAEAVMANFQKRPPVFADE